jgi:hypothetical protein
MKPKRIKYALAFVLIGFSSCDKNENPEPVVPVDRTIIIYMAGDNDLTRQGETPDAVPHCSSFGSYKTNEIRYYRR